MAAKLVGFAPSRMAPVRELLGAATASGSRCFGWSSGGVIGKWRSRSRVQPAPFGGRVLSQRLVKVDKIIPPFLSYVRLTPAELSA